MAVRPDQERVRTDIKRCFGGPQNEYDCSEHQERGRQRNHYQHRSHSNEHYSDDRIPGSAIEEPSATK